DRHDDVRCRVLAIVEHRDNVAVRVLPGDDIATLRADPYRARIDVLRDVSKHVVIGCHNQLAAVYDEHCVLGPGAHHVQVASGGVEYHVPRHVRAHTLANVVCDVAPAVPGVSVIVGSA